MSVKFWQLEVGEECRGGGGGGGGGGGESQFVELLVDEMPQ